MHPIDGSDVTYADNSYIYGLTGFRKAFFFGDLLADLPIWYFRSYLEFQIGWSGC